MWCSLRELSCQPLRYSISSCTKRDRVTLTKGSIALPSGSGSGSRATRFTSAQGARSIEISSPVVTSLLDQSAFPTAPKSLRNGSASSSQLKTGKKPPSSSGCDACPPNWLV